MTADLLDRLRASDPARDLDATAPEELLQTLLATPRPQARRRRPRRKKLVLLPAAAIAGAAALLVLLPGGSPDLAARAYAQTAPAHDSILYVHTTTTLSQRVPGDNNDKVSSSARWQQGERWHAITHFGKDEVVEEIRGADGVLHFSDGETARREDGGDAQQYIDRRATGFLAEFRSDYETGRLDESGEAVFNGRPAKRYVVVEKEGESRGEYFLDAETGMPLGSRRTGALYRSDIGADRRPKLGPKIGTLTDVTTVDALEQLPATPENEKQLSG
jgi:hypothetical protein